MENTQLETIEAHRYISTNICDEAGNCIPKLEFYCLEKCLESPHLLLIEVNSKILKVCGVEELPEEDCDESGNGTRYMGKVMVNKKWVTDCIQFQQDERMVRAKKANLINSRPQLLTEIEI